MMNLVTLIGRLTADPELRKTQTGTSVTNITLAVTRNFNKEETDFIKCQVWRQSAEYLNSYARKGDMVAVEGRIQVSQYQTSDVTKRSDTAVVCDRVYLLSKKEQKTQVAVENKVGDIGVFRAEIVSDDGFDLGETLDVNQEDFPF